MEYIYNDDKQLIVIDKLAKTLISNDVNMQNNEEVTS